MLPGRAAERRLARFGLSELLQRRRVVRQPPALIRPRSAFSARMHRVVGIHRPRARMPFPHHLDHAVAGEMGAEKLRNPRSNMSRVKVLDFTLWQEQWSSVRAALCVTTRRHARRSIVSHCALLGTLLLFPRQEASVSKGYWVGSV